MKRRRPQPPSSSFDRTSTPLVLFGLIASEAMLACSKEETRIRSLFAQRIAFERAHFTEPDLWIEREYAWRPVRCMVEYEPLPNDGYTAAPTLKLVAERDLSEVRGVRVTICRLGLLRVRESNWPTDFPKPTLGKEPLSLREAQDMARMFVQRATAPLFSFVDPMRS